MVAENAVEVKPSKALRVHRFVAGDEVRIAREPVADDEDRVVTVRRGELDNEVN